MTTTVCTTCFPGWEQVEILTVPAMRPCDRCGRPASECHVFRESAVPTLQPHQQRVVDEASELEQRLNRLETFLRTPIRATLDPAEQVRLCHQSMVMQVYLLILRERIAAFGSPK